MVKYVKIDLEYARFLARKILIKSCMKSTPVNVADIISFLGNVEIHFKDLETEDAYVSYFDKTKKYRIYINSNSNEKRARFSIAHELGHIYLEHFLKYDVDNLSSQQLKYLDIEANAFANELLVPDCLFCEHIGESIDELTRIFKVSKQVIEIKLSMLEKIAK